MEILAQWAFAKNYLESGSDVAISVILLIPTKIIINQNMSLETYKEKKLMFTENKIYTVNG